MCAGVAVAEINVLSDGSDRELYVTSNTVWEIDLSEAVTGNWDDDNSANYGKGIYDSNMWAVVFKYSNVVVETDAEVTFKNHPSRAPVVWLVSGDVTIDGTVGLDGDNYVPSPGLAEPGPGGFRGGMGRYSAAWVQASGFGPGGARPAYAGSYGTKGQHTSHTADPYGNPSLVPLIGGSGGAGGTRGVVGGGGAGGGAILIACANTLTVDGVVRADGGAGDGDTNAGGGGSGGGIRLVADTLSGGGVVQANGGYGRHYRGGMGRIRIAYETHDDTIDAAPDASVFELQGLEPAIWLPEDGPRVKIVSIGGETVPDDPRANLGTGAPDVMLAETNLATVLVETENVHTNSLVQIRVTSRGNASHLTRDAAVTQIVSTDPLVVRWTANVPVTTGSSALQVKVVKP